MHTLCNPIPGGSTFPIQWDDEVIEVHLPPRGFTIDRIPDLETGKPSYELVRCEILNEHLPIEDQKWHRTPLPPEWKKWRKEEITQQKMDPTYVHPKCNEFRTQEWKRKINGVWVAIGNRNGQPTEYVYLTGQFYDFVNWWYQDFGYPRLRLTLRKEFYCIQYVKDHPLIHGVTLSTNRRRGKTSISMHNLWYEQSFKKNRRAGMQAQTRNDASDKFEESFIFGWRNQPDFFKPVYDYNSKHKSEMLFKRPVSMGKKQVEDNEEEDDTLNCKIDFRETKPTSYDGYKLHDFSFEEPGKWTEADIYQTMRILIPSTRDNYSKIGFIFAPTTIEDLDAGGDKFIEMFEHSRPSTMKKNASGKTTSNLISLFISAAEGYVFDEYGRSIVDDPKPDEIVIAEDGARIFTGAKTKILQEREPFRGNYQLLAGQVRQYPMSWDEAKMMTSQQSPFNVTILQKRLDELQGSPSYPYITGNFEWVDQQDGMVEFVRDDLGGRWALSKLLDKEGVMKVEGDKRESNRVGHEFYDNKKLWYPLNNKYFRMGADPIRLTRTDDPRFSKAGAYVWEMYNPAIDLNVKTRNWQTNNFCGEYLYRPDDFNVFGEDMIKAMRYFGCSICAEDNVQTLNQYLKSRNYGQFFLYKGDFDENIIKQTSQDDAYKGLYNVDETVNAYLQQLVGFVVHHGHRIKFPSLVKQMIAYQTKDRTKYDAVTAAGFTIIASLAKVLVDIKEEPFDIEEVFPLFEQSGFRSKLKTG